MLCVMCDKKVVVSTLEECKKSEEEGYEVSAITYWEGSPDTTQYHMVKIKNGKKTSVQTY